MIQPAESWQSAEQVENSVDYQALLVAAAGKPERAMGKAVIPAEPPQWKEVLRLADKLQMRQPAHLSVLASIIMAETHLRGFAGLRSSFDMVMKTLQENWVEVFPVADEDVPEEPYYGRVNIIRELDQPAFLACVHRLPLVSVRGIGEFSARDIDVSAGNVQADDKEKERCQGGIVRAAFEQADLQNLSATADAMDDASRLIQSLVLLFSQEARQSDPLSLDGLVARLADCKAKFMEFAESRLQSNEALQAKPEVADQGGVESGSPVLATATAVPATQTASANDGLRTREDAVECLSSIIHYYQQCEPSSPVIILAHRARELIPQSYFQMLQHLAPGHQSSFAEIVQALADDPLAFLIEDSYQRFVKGESIPIEGEKVRGSSDGARMHDLPSGVDAQPLDSTGHGPEPVSGVHGDQHTVNSRQDALVLLAEIERYFRHNEPSSPIPLIMVEMQKLVSKTFADLLVQYAGVKQGSASASVAESNKSE